MRSPSVSAELQRVGYQLQKEKLMLLAEMGGLAEGRKKCFKCQKVKPLNDFYLHPKTADGRLGKCKQCTKKDARENYTDTRKKRAEYDKQRRYYPRRIVMARKWRADSDKRNPLKTECRKKTKAAINSGRLLRLPYQICGNVKSQAHHSDYSKPYEIEWLCFKHHCERHGKHIVE